MDALSASVDDGAPTKEHEVTLTGLSPNTSYFYSIGSTSSQLASGEGFVFRTPPPAGTVQPTRVWIIGDSGTANVNAAAVRDAYLAFNGSHHTDVWLMLGDNAYNTGSDAEYQAAVFDMYPTILSRTLLWSTIGNHETYSLGPEVPTYLQAFTFPTQGEAGGLPSGTERYYSFDYANIHFICLDSMTSDRSPTGAMAQWLRADLEATEQGWIVAFWHHPPYSKGSHNSDIESELVEMRQNILPILEAGGVDLVFSGHSHSYERSRLIDGHYGDSSTLTQAMVLDGGSGRPGGTGAYRKPLGLSSNQGTVYTVAGTSGQISWWTDGSFVEANPHPHPVMYKSILALGSVVLDVNGDRLDAKFIRSNGDIDDSFTILKNIPNLPPTVSISIPHDGDEFVEHSDISIVTRATDRDGMVQHVEFYANDTLIGSDTHAPFNIRWSEVPLGNYTIIAVATDNLGANAVSSPIHISVVPPPAAPAPPATLTATGGQSQIDLTWARSAGATRYTVLRSPTDGGPYSAIGSTGGNITSYSDMSLPAAGTYYYVVRAGNLGGDSGDSPQANASTFVHVLAGISNGAIDGESDGARFRRFGVPSINDAGSLAFMASYDTASGGSVGIFAGKPPVPIARRGDAAPGIAGASFQSFADPLLNGLGQVAFLARIASGGVNGADNETLWSDRTGTLALVAREGAEPPGVPGARWRRFQSVVLGDQMLAFTASLTAGVGGVSGADDMGLWITSGAGGGVLSLALREGQSLTVSGAQKTVKSFLTLRNGSIGIGQGYASGFDAVPARVTFTDGTQGLFAFGASGYTELAATSASAPGYAAGAKFHTFGMPGFVSGGAVFGASLQRGAGGVSAANERAIYLRDGAGLTRLFAMGDAAPGTDVGTVFAGFKDPVATDEGHVAVLATMAGEGVGIANDAGVWWHVGTDAPVLVAREGAAAPGIGTSGAPGLFASFTSLAYSHGPAGAPLFLARLRRDTAGVNASNDTGLWAMDSSRALRMLLRSGEPLAGKTVRSFRTLSAVTRSPAQARSFNASRQVVSRIVFTDRTQGIIVTSLP